MLFSDGSPCDVLETGDGYLTCEVSGFDAATLDPSTPYTVDVVVNGVQNTLMSVNVLGTKQSGLSISPSSVSPVLAQNITVNLESTYPHALDAADFKAKLVHATDNTITKPLYIVAVDDATKSVVIKYPGADSGDYLVQLSST